MEAVFQDGVFKPVSSPELCDGERVRLTVERVPSAGPDEILGLARQVYAGFGPQDLDEVDALARHRRRVVAAGEAGAEEGAMKTLEMDEATGQLGSYASQVRREPVVVTERGKPVMALVPIDNADLETVSLSTDPGFMALIERSRALFKAGTGIPLGEIKRKYGIRTKAKPARRQRLGR